MVWEVSPSPLCLEHSDHQMDHSPLDLDSLRRAADRYVLPGLNNGDPPSGADEPLAAD